MKWKDLFENWSLQKINLKLPFGEMEFSPNAEDEIAAWEMYVELITRVTTQRIMPEEGDEKEALNSIVAIFAITRSILKHYGRKCREFTRLAVIILNQVIRPFTTKWHRLSLQNAFQDPKQCSEFRSELSILQNNLRQYTKLLSNIAKVEDLTDSIL